MGGGLRRATPGESGATPGLSGVGPGMSETSPEESRAPRRHLRRALEVIPTANKTGHSLSLYSLFFAQSTPLHCATGPLRTLFFLLFQGPAPFVCGGAPLAIWMGPFPVGAEAALVGRGTTLYSPSASLSTPCRSPSAHCRGPRYARNQRHPQTQLRDWPHLTVHWTGSGPIGCNPLGGDSAPLRRPCVKPRPLPLHDSGATPALARMRLQRSPHPAP